MLIYGRRQRLIVDKKYDLPAMPFYVGDWLKCPEVRALPPDYRGLWFDLICFMWESTERGVMVKPNGKPYTDTDIVRMVGLDNQNTGFWLTHLLDNGVCSRRSDGAIFSKRMIKDEKLRILRREIGKRGGNPNILVNRTLKSEVNQNIENENENENEDVIKKNKDNRGVGKEGKRKNKEVKTKYLDSVFLATNEYEKLVERFGKSGTSARIENLNNGIMSKGYKYKSHYHTILSWEKRNERTGTHNQNTGNDTERVERKKQLDSIGTEITNL